MKTIVGTLLAVFNVSAVLAQTVPPLSEFSTKMEAQGGAVSEATEAASGVSSYGLDQFSSDVPTNQLSKLAQNQILEANQTARGARDVQLYRTISPSVVFVANKEGFGSGSLLDAAGDVITNWHVVKGYSIVAVIFKPSVEGKEATRDEIKLARVIRYDEIADLALIKTSEIPLGREPIRLADSSEVAVGMDVHAIGHPEGETWTYTTGVISQYRQKYKWKVGEDSISHVADVIQTQTPINAGNSGGPLISDSGTLVGVNTFKDSSGEGLSYAVSISEIRRFLARSDNRAAQDEGKPKVSTECKPKRRSQFRNDKSDATVVAFDMFCTGKDSAELVTPDDQRQAIFLRLDRNGDGNVDAVVFDFKRRGKWDLSFWDESYTGHWSLVGYHDDGSLKPTRFESYAQFQKRASSR
jgi:S1-C subfamily serine protease